MTSEGIILRIVFWPADTSSLAGVATISRVVPTYEETRSEGMARAPVV